MGKGLSPMSSTVYLESTIPSYLAAHLSRDLIVAAHQQITHEWWRRARPNFDVYVSQAVLDEIRRGDPDAASRRLVLVRDLPFLPLTEEVSALAREYEARLGQSPAARFDLMPGAFAGV